jgi:hypothetical protein
MDGADKVTTENDGGKQRRELIHWYDSQLHTMAEFKAIQMLMGYYDELITEMEGNEQEAQTPSRDEAKPAKEAEHEKQEDVKMELNITKELQESPSATLKDKQTKPAEEATRPTSNEEGSSSIEPGWGRTESSKEKERLEDLKLWESNNIGGYTNQRTTKAYRHGRYYMCSKPVSTTSQPGS